MYELVRVPVNPCASNATSPTRIDSGQSSAPVEVEILTEFFPTAEVSRLPRTRATSVVFAVPSGATTVSDAGSVCCEVSVVNSLLTVVVICS